MEQYGKSMLIERMGSVEFRLNILAATIFRYSIRALPILTVYLGIAIPGSRDSRIPGSRTFSNPEIPGLSRTQSRDFGINKIYFI